MILWFSFLFCSPGTLREKANLAVTLANEKDDILAHASFFDHPAGDLVDQAHWEAFLQQHFRAEKCTVCIDLLINSVDGWVGGQFFHTVS